MITYDIADCENATPIRGIGESTGDERFQIPERLLWKLWKRRAAKEQELRTGSGKRVRVLYPGRLGTSAGPDFRDALLDVEGLGVVRGDVEIHRRQRDWASHGHGDDPNYNGVVVHGALEVDESETVLQGGASAPVISLQTLLDDAGVAVDCDHDGDAQVTSDLWEVLARCGYPRPASLEQAAGLLDRAGDERFRRKAATLGRFASEQGPEQAMYEALLEGLGYRHNQQPFVKLAQTAPFAALRSAMMPVLSEQRPMVLRHWLLFLAGLGDADPGARKHLPAGIGPAMERRDWHLFRVRPSNHPAVRIQGATALVARFLEGGLLPGLAGACGSPKQLMAALAVEPWDGCTAPIGPGRARDLAVNVALPMLHGVNGHGVNGHGVNGHGVSGQMETPYLTLYRRFPMLQGNEVVREMAEQLLPPEWRGEVKNARRQQGLLHLAALLRGAG